MSRYLVTEYPYVLGTFATLDAVTISVFDMDGNVVAVDDANMTEIATTGVFQWSTENLTNPVPTTSGIIRYLFVMDNGVTTLEDTIEWGGYPDLLTGLSQQNVYIDQCIYSSTYGGLESARMRIYDEAANVGTASGVIATYILEANIVGAGQFTYWKQVKS